MTIRPGLHADNLRQRRAQRGLVRDVDLTDECDRDLVARPVHGPLHEFRTSAHKLDLLCNGHETVLHPRQVLRNTSAIFLQILCEATRRG